MEKLIRKENVEQFNSYFSWGYYFSAGYLFYKKIKMFLSNEYIEIFYI
ncbi:hypothetical protein [Crassaminicella thermophila]|nr:hypothetical protein [Crassaminicella thermophila]